MLKLPTINRNDPRLILGTRRDGLNQITLREVVFKQFILHFHVSLLGRSRVHGVMLVLHFHEYMKVMVFDVKA